MVINNIPTIEKSINILYERVGSTLDWEATGV